MNVQVTGDKILEKLQRRISEDAKRIAVLEATVEALNEQLEVYMPEDEKEEEFE